MDKVLAISYVTKPGGSVTKDVPTNDVDAGSIPVPGRSSREGTCQPAPVFLPGKYHGERSLAGYSPQGHKTVQCNLAINNNKASFIQ